MVDGRWEQMSGTLSKDSLRERFGKDYKDYYSTKLFESEGFERRKCKGCGKYFWTAGSKDYCGDSEHEPYSFIRDNQSGVDYVDFWKAFASFFKSEGHGIIERYPVVSRWRQDLYFTIAGIQDFQRIENGKMAFEYPANPLLVPQMCMRFNDIPNVGITGRHFTSFMMANQTAFDYPKAGYWRDRTIELNYEFLTKHLGVKKEDLTYVEDVWAMGDFSEFGPSLESFANGLEIVNSVFTQFEYANGAVKELPGKVVDVGWGFERLLWFKSGKDTAYDAAFPKALDYIHKTAGIKPDAKLYRKVAEIAGYVDVGELNDAKHYEQELLSKSGISREQYLGVIRPMQAAYAIADHTRTLLFGISDGALPSNVGGGYNLRIILRRAFDLMEEYNLDIDLMQLMRIHSDSLKGLYGNLLKDEREMEEILELERQRHVNTKRAASAALDSMLKKGTSMDSATLKLLYESYGITPEHVATVASSKNMKVEIPENFYSKVVKGDFVEGRKAAGKAPAFDVEGLPKTEKLFYSLQESADANVIKVIGNAVVLDRTPFYAEGGGQEADRGTIGGFRVKDVQSVLGVIVHIIDGQMDLQQGMSVKCEVDSARRARLMAHHTATHIVSAAARAVLGQHAWQEGAKKSPDKAHIDVSHYKSLSAEDVRKIEERANLYVTEGIRVKMSEYERNEAERLFGFTIYQGHGAPAGRLRIVEIRDLSGKLIDAEACGGLHLMGREGMLGFIKIIGASRIHDGIDRLEFVAGPALLDRLIALEDKSRRGLSLLDDYKETFSGMTYFQSIGALADSLPGIAAQLESLRALGKELSSKVVSGEVERIAASAEDGKMIILGLHYGRQMLRSIANELAERMPKLVVLLYNGALEIVCISGRDSGVSASEFVKAQIGKINPNASFIGGGSARIAEGRFAEEKTGANKK